MNFVHQSGQIIIIHLPEMLGHFGMIPLINHDSRLRSNSEVVMKFTQMVEWDDEKGKICKIPMVF